MLLSMQKNYHLTWDPELGESIRKTLLLWPKIEQEVGLVGQEKISNSYKPLCVHFWVNNGERFGNIYKS